MTEPKLVMTDDQYFSGLVVGGSLLILMGTLLIIFLTEPKPTEVKSETPVVAADVRTM